MVWESRVCGMGEIKVGQGGHARGGAAFKACRVI